jgi:hypothetical protein
MQHCITSDEVRLFASLGSLHRLHTAATMRVRAQTATVSCCVRQCKARCVVTVCTPPTAMPCVSCARSPASVGLDIAAAAAVQCVCFLQPLFKPCMHQPG